MKRLLVVGLLSLSFAPLYPQAPPPHTELEQYARQGEREKAISFLGAAIEAGFAGYDHIQRDPDLENIRGGPPFPGTPGAAGGPPEVLGEPRLRDPLPGGPPRRGEGRRPLTPLGRGQVELRQSPPRP